MLARGDYFTNFAARVNRPPYSKILSLADQGVMSLANFALTISLIRTSSTVAFSAYGLGMFLALAVAGSYRIGFIVPISLFAPSKFRRLSAPIRQMQMVNMYAVGVCGLICIGILHLVGVGFYAITVFGSAFSCFLTYTTTEMDRMILMKSEGVTLSFVASSFNALAICLLCAAIWAVNLPIELTIAILGALAIAKATIINGVPDPAKMRSARRLWAVFLNRSLGWGGLGNVSSAMYLTVPQWVLGIVSIPIEVAGFTAVRAPLQPMMLTLRAFDIVDKIAFGNADQHDERTTARSASRTVITYALVSVIFSSLMSYFAYDIIYFLIGKTYLAFSSTLMLTSVFFVFVAVAAPLETIIFKKGLFREYALHQLVGLAIAGIVVYPLVWHYQANGAVMTSIIGSLPPYIMLLRHFVSTLKKAYGR